MSYEIEEKNWCDIIWKKINNTPRPRYTSNKIKVLTSVTSFQTKTANSYTSKEIKERTGVISFRKKKQLTPRYTSIFNRGTNWCEQKQLRPQYTSR